MSVIEEKTAFVAQPRLSVQTTATNPQSMQGVTGPDASASAITTIATSTLTAASSQAQKILSLFPWEILPMLVAIKDLPAFLAANNGANLEILKPQLNDVARLILNGLYYNPKSTESRDVHFSPDDLRRVLGAIQTHVTSLQGSDVCPENLEQIDTKSFSDLADFFPNVTQFILNINSSHDRKDPRVAQAELQMIQKGISHYTTLKNLKILFSPIQDKELGEILKNNPTLEEFQLLWCPKLVDSWSSLIAQQCNNLRTCVLADENGDHSLFTGKTAAEILKNNPNMQHFGIKFCSKLSDETLWAILQNSSNLESLEVPCSYHITGVKPQSMLGQAVNCAKLLRLDLTSCYGLTDQGLKEILSSCPNIQSVNIDSCSRLTAEGLKESLALCKNLQELNLSDCWKLSEEGVKTILSVCPNLQRLDLYRCNLTGPGSWIFHLCPQLQFLRVPECTYNSNGKNYNHLGF